MAAILGLRAKLYRNTGTFGAPIFKEIGNVRDLTLALEKGEADVTTRQNDGWRATLPTLRDASAEFEMVWDDSEVDFNFIFQAWLAESDIEFFILSGDRTVPGVTGLRALMQVLNVSRSEPLEEAVKASITIKPTFSPNPPNWVTGPLS